MNIDETLNKHLINEMHDYQKAESVVDKHMKNMVKELKKTIDIDKYAGTDEWSELEDTIRETIDYYLERLY